MAFPGKKECGKLEVVDIGLKTKHARKIIAKIKHNSPSLWKSNFPRKTWKSHKYKHGHSLVFAGEMPGAAILTCVAALRTGAGLVSVVCSPNQKTLFSLVSPNIIVREDLNGNESDIFNGKIEYNSVVFGPGVYPSQKTRDIAKFILAQKVPTVLDAGALSAFEGHQHELFSNLHRDVIITLTMANTGAFFMKIRK